MTSLPERLQQVRDKIQAAAELSGRDAASVALLPISKGQPPWIVKAAVDLGLRQLGENRVQEAVRKAAAVADPSIEWHLVGALQKNKVRAAVELFPWIHSVDSMALLERIERIASELGRRPRVLIQVDLAGEATKTGVPPVVIPEMLRRAADLPHVEVEGLMLLPPFFEQAERVRPYFRKTADLLRELDAASHYRSPLRHLSMGMSHDFDIAISEGATIVRVGTALFGERPRPGSPEAM